MKRRAQWFGGTLVVVIVVVVFVPNVSRYFSRVDVVEERQHGLSLYEAGRFADAVTTYEHALTIEDDVATRTNLANALSALDRHDDALRQYHAVLALDPNNAVVWFDLGNLLRTKMHDTRAAADAYRRATELAPTMAEAQFDLGVTLIDLRDYEAAIATIEAALQLAPSTISWRKDAENALLLAHTRALEMRDAAKTPR